jgi:hypothetical protein
MKMTKKYLILDNGPGFAQFYKVNSMCRTFYAAEFKNKAPVQFYTGKYSNRAFLSNKSCIQTKSCRGAFYKLDVMGGG